MTGLDAARRAVLERLIIRARSILEKDLEAQAEGRYGINSDGSIEDEAALHLDPSALADRREIVAIVEHIRDEGETTTGAVTRLIREATFTHLNRLVAIRVAEAMGFVPPSLAEGRASRGFREVLEVAPLVAGDETGGYWTYLRLCGDEMAGDAPALFDPRNPLLTLSAGVAALDDLVTLFSDPAAHDIWTASDTFGWAYQFFNTGDERRQMRDESAAPRNSRELAVRNQFFTPRYVVDFLVQNTLGRRLIEDDPKSPLVDELPLLVDPPTEAGPPLDLHNVAALDPACGSGHFLLGCYDLLERAWELLGVPPSESAPAIVTSLWGVDIDPRCAQVASAAIVLRARRHRLDLPLPRPNIVTARSLPGGSAALPRELGLTDQQRDLVDRISEVLANAPLLGPLLKAEEALEQEIRHAPFGGDAGTLPLSEDAFSRVEADLMAHLQAVADRASSSVAERLLAAEADDALRLLELVRNRYDAVLMNPPFGEPVPETKPYLRAAYPWLPTKDNNLLAAFVGRGLELCKPDGYLGAITARSGMFLSGFEQWRRQVLLGNRLTALADLGFGVMEQAMVEAAAYVVGPGRPTPDCVAKFIRLLKDTDRAGALVTAVRADRADAGDRRVFRVRLADFEAIPGAPIAYWMAPSIRRLFTDLPRLEGNGAEARQGLATGDDFRFVRAFWEVEPRRIARSAAETHDGKRWCPFAKGGEYSPYWADIHLVVDYEHEGAALRQLRSSRVQNTQYYFRPGLTWPRRTNSAMGVRILPAGCVFADKGPAIVTDDPVLHLAWMNSRFVRLLVDSTAASADETQTGGVPSRSYEVGMVQSLPSPMGIEADVDQLKAATNQIADQLAQADREDETSRRFTAVPVTDMQRGVAGTALSRALAASRAAAAVTDLYAVVDQIFARTLDPEHLAGEALRDAAGELVGLLPATLAPGARDDALRLLAADGATVIEAATESVGMARWIRLQHQIVDRRLETAAVALGCHPSVLADLAETERILPPDEPRRTAGDLISYVVGAAFGRWDVRIGRDPGLAPSPPPPFDSVPLCPPGMLVSPDGFPAADPPATYPLRFPPGRLLIDEPGHPWDIEACVLRAAETLFDDPAVIMSGMLEILGRRTVRDYLRRQFFREHLSRYSKSRRKAPIYWPLAVPSKNWGVWVYAPELSRETLFAIAGEAARREALAAEATRRLQAERDAGGSGRSTREVTEALTAEEALAEELGTFKREAERIAGLGWEPNLDDGIILCAAPLATLFPAWPDAGKEREKIRKGEYPWATVSRWKDAL